MLDDINQCHKIEAGAPNESAIQSGLDTATSVLNDLLETEELKPAAGTFVGRFRLESDGTVRMFLTDKSTSITNADGGKLEDAFIGLVPDLLEGVTVNDVAAAFVRATTPRPEPRVDVAHVAPIRLSVANPSVSFWTSAMSTSKTAL